MSARLISWSCLQNHMQCQEPPNEVLSLFFLSCTLACHIIRSSLAFFWVNPGMVCCHLQAKNIKKNRSTVLIRNPGCEKVWLRAITLPIYWVHKSLYLRFSKVLLNCGSSSDIQLFFTWYRYFVVASPNLVIICFFYC